MAGIVGDVGPVLDGVGWSFLACSQHPCAGSGQAGSGGPGKQVVQAWGGWSTSRLYVAFGAPTLFHCSPKYSRLFSSLP